MESKVYNQKGEEVGKIKLSEAVFATEWNQDLVHQVVVSMQANARKPVAHAKDRSEVRGGGKKPWKQKGTGRARHGSIRSPIWRGGGVTFGPRNEKDYSKKINKKMRAKALCSAVSKKLEDSEILFIDALEFDAPKTAIAKSVLQALSKIKGFDTLTTKKRNVALLSLPAKDENVIKSFNNFGNVKVADIASISPVDVLKYKYLIVVNPEFANQKLESRLK